MSPRDGKKKNNRKLRDRVRGTDKKSGMVETARWLRQRLPGDERFAEEKLSTMQDRLPDRLAREVTARQGEEQSAARELGLGVLQAWQALSEKQKRGRGTVDTAILFTDLVKFSTWALEAGDEAALELIRLVGAAEDTAISKHGGAVVKRLGDGAMAVFSNAEDAVRSAHQAQAELGKIEVEGHTPELRAGVHLGRPRRIGRDYLGVDVNIAARVADAAKGGEVLVSESTCEKLDQNAFKLGRSKRLEAAGAPEEFAVCSVKPR